ncbi:UDP-N-acetylglucosamine/UDP-glucose/GDP-mannose transporter isoform X4 [Equus quagga]|uniref:UDP-N-acetylglucosamine/UDP-glucose/GDP-mannose transporter isoform X4 n=1 Tax=Equus quagga TaxID=89248 RepID=UPI001EE239A2|nr:UDP-N-acetylglucosamine/UDP-glucose/GDP-mannose transporter isoform X4 [Equus quagga]
MSAGGQAGAGVAGGDAASAGPPPRGAQLLSALFYGTCSFLLVLVNKALLTTYRFPSPVILGIGQMAATIMILYVSKLNKIIHFPDFDKKIPVKLFPLPLLYVGNHISGLSSTSKLSSDLAFNLEGYIFVFLNDIFTAANGVYTKQKMDPKELGKYGVLFYNACFMIVPTLVLSASTGDLRQATEFNQWKNVLFLIQFLLSCFLGFLLMYSTVLCSHYNSPLTTAVVGAIKHGGGLEILLFNSEQPVKTETTGGRRKHPAGFEGLESGTELQTDWQTGAGEEGGAGPTQARECEAWCLGPGSPPTAPPR